MNRLLVAALLVAAVYALLLWAFVRNARAADPAFYNVCAGQIGSARYSNRASDGSFLVRCPDGTITLEIKNCKGSVSYDASYNVLVACEGSARKIPIVRGPYPR